MAKRNLEKQQPKKKPRNPTASPTKIIVGQVDHVRPNCAYVVTKDAKQDILVQGKQLGTAVNKDWVKVALHPCKSSKNKQPQGRVIKVIKRHPLPMIGIVSTIGKRPKAIVTQKRLRYTITLEGPGATGLSIRDKVAIHLHPFKPGAQKLTGQVAQDLGSSGSHQTEIHAIMAEFGLSSHFPDEVNKTLEEIPKTIPDTEIKKRKDLRHLPTFTIDPVDAQDFDDALSYQQLDNGLHQIGVHIADVSHYVVPKSLIDQEAYARNTSVYLVDRCIPMLPELLSNQLCSLRPHEDKLAFSALMQIDEHGKVHDTWLGATIIQSDQRFSYKSAQDVIDSQAGSFYPELAVLNQLAKQMRLNRIKKGSINFEIQEWQFALNEEGTPIEMMAKPALATHKLVEEFMLLANKQVGSFMAQQNKKSKNPLPFIYRVHDPPDREKLAHFFDFVQQLGYPIKEGSTPQKMQKLEQLIQGKPEESMIQSLAIRSMAKAHYTTEAKPHFALAFSYYTHFTSPIRRYADLVAHRLLKKKLQNKPVDLSIDYEGQCIYALEREHIAMAAERSSIKYKQVEWIQSQPSQIWMGMVHGITESNLYILFTQNGCEGVLAKSDLKDDFYIFEPKKFQLRGKKTGQRYCLGDAIQVKIKNCDINKRMVTLLPA